MLHPLSTVLLDRKTRPEFGYTSCSTAVASLGKNTLAAVSFDRTEGTVLPGIPLNPTLGTNNTLIKGSSEKRTERKIRGFGTTPSKQKTILNKYKYFKDQYAVKYRYIQI